MRKFYLRLIIYMRNIKLTLEYDGTDFCGWQIQPDCRTVQGVLESAVAQITRTPAKVIGAGRTDAGVHALGQVCNFITNSALSEEELFGSLNGVLPVDAVVRRIEQVDGDFHSRYKALRRIYRYVITSTRRAVERRYMYYCPHTLDVGEMQKAAEYLLGEHDCSSFESTGSDQDNPLCDIFRVQWESRGDRLHFVIEANRFLRKMVRSIVGTLLQIGLGKYSSERFKEILESKDRSLAGDTIPPHGLFLESVGY